MSGRDEVPAVSVLCSPSLPPMGVERVCVPSGGGNGALNGGTPPGAGPTATIVATDRGAEEPPRKRNKLATGDDAAALRRRILEYELVRLRNLRERFTEQLSELYFLQAGGNMIDYAVWRKRPPAPQLLAFLEARRPPPVTDAQPVAPAAPLPVPVPTPAPAPHPVLAPADEMVEKAKQEAYVASRVAELARAGLWAERRLPRVLEPPRPKTHWDYLLEEMAWLAQDFAHERKWKKQAAKKCARAVQKYFQDKALAAQKAEKAQELQLRKIAAFAAKEIRTFWANVEKLVEWKRVRRVERARKEALDEQLSYIVDRTEQYSRQLAANLTTGTPGAPGTPVAPPSDEEFQPGGSSDDDEETIAAAEREAAHCADDHRDEIEALRRESRLDLGDLLPPGYLRAHSPPPSDYGPDGDDSTDDETTIAEQERTEAGKDDAAAELAALQQEADLDIGELVRRYAAAPPHSGEGDESSASSSSPSSSSSSSDEEGEGGSSSASEALESLMEESGETVAGSEQRVEAAASLAASLQPTGTTLSETAVGTRVPALLRHTLREYQQVGLHWLATMHARRLNGVLADEMGLGKTVQTIALLAHLAAERGEWGPHLVVAPTSVVLNWEMEFKKWCPAFKILTYYGTIRERKLKRVGWTKPNSFHVCITSYKLVVQDHQSFRRKRWNYLILDEAQNIKNFKSQRWQLLLNFQAERRLLLTGTPLQNSLLELWSLMHFLMPDVFASHSEFREWFSEVADMAEGAPAHNEPLLRRLHAVLRPFLLRRLKADVERQMPRKYEHVLMCRLAKRQRCLYDDFMARAKTRESLASGNLLSVINVLMQLRKVCNHPDLFEPRPVVSPLHLAALEMHAPALALRAGCEARPELAARLGGDLATFEAGGAGAFAAHRARHLAPPRRCVEEMVEPRRRPPPPRPPPASVRLHLRLVPRAAPASAPPLPPPTVSIAGARRRRPRPTQGAAAPPRSGSAPSVRLEARRRACLRRLAATNERRCWRLPLYGADLRTAVSTGPPPVPPRDVADVLTDLHEVIDRFSVCWAGALAAAPRLVAGCGEGARAWRRRVKLAEAGVEPALRRLLALLHAPASRQAVAFPHPSLLQYDCGKLQTLATLLRRLKGGGHRVLIFTQMTRVLDVLEAFLSMHGYTYLRLDGATRVDRRQPLVDRFNADARVFAFILSTRSGGVGLNLTGADSVVFYDSDWNPTMDAQAQDRCHRIGQTRDVHVYRLVTAATVEENILRKAEQKRALGHLAIEGGNFTTSYLRASNIKELFGGEGGESEAGGGGGGEGPGPELESALAAAEDEADAAAAHAARQEAQGELAEFDETVPLDEEARALHQEPDADAGELAALMSQLTPIEKYAMRVVESGEAATEAERAALSEMRRQLREWEQARRQLKEDTPPTATADHRPGEAESQTQPQPDPELTYCREDARAKVWASGATHERMPMWCPPTPPSGDGDVYCESWVRALYRPGAAPDALLPPVHRRESRAAREPRRARGLARATHAPLSLFERAGPKQRPRTRPPPPPHVHSHPPHAPASTPQTEWAPSEDAALRRALRLQRLPQEPPAALAPNWDWVAELVNEAARAFRSARACRDRHDALADPERARRRHRRPPAARRRLDDDRPRPPLNRLDAMRDAAERRRSAPKRRLDDPQHRNPKHAQLLADHGVEYDAPPTPMEVAARRADRIAKEKLKAGTGAAAPVPPAPGVGTAAPSAPPSRIVVAAPSTRADAPRRARPQPGEGARAAAPQPQPAQPQQAQAQAHLLYRHQTFPTRHLKILHQSAASPIQGTATAGASVAAAASTEGGAALRKLQLQQLALRRTAGTSVGSSAAAAVVAAPPISPASASAVNAGTGATRLVAAARHPHHSHVVVAHLAAPAPSAPHQPTQSQPPQDRPCRQ